jgi:methionyl-tRNA formyltransferase
VVTAVRVVFFGTPAFAVPTLQALASAGHAIAGVVTQPDRPRGRGQRVQPSAVKAAATGLGLRIWQPATLNDAAFVQELRSAAPDLGVVAAYGRILPVDLLALPRLGMVNLHASLLPRWRGAAPVHRAMLAGDEVTGVTIMRVVKALDAGPMLAAESTPIDPDETSVDLEARLAAMGAGLLVRTVEALARGPVAEVPQDESRVTYAARLDRMDGRLDFSRSAREVHNAIRGLQPWPLAAARLGDQRLLLLASQAIPDETTTAPPGTVVRIDPDALAVATGSGVVRLLRLQREGRPPVTVRDFVNGQHVQAGDRFVPVPAVDA